MRELMNGHSVSPCNHGMKRQENQKNHLNRDALLWGQLWTNGLICAFEFVLGSKPDGIKLSKSSPLIEPGVTVKDKLDEQNCPEDFQSGHLNGKEDCLPKSCWIPIGWERISELVQTVQVNAGWASHPTDFLDEEDDVTVADLAAPYWERPVGPSWWCHVAADHPNINAWLSNAQWLHPAISTALRDESKLISERMKHLLYEVPVRVAGGLLFELLGQSAGDPLVDEDDIPIVLRSWQAQNFLLATLHVKGSAGNINVLGIAEVQCFVRSCLLLEVVTYHELFMRLFRKSNFGAADEVNFKFVNRRTHEDMHLFGIILNQEIRRLSTQVIRVKWSLHAREEIVFELLQHLKGNLTRSLLEGIRKTTREMIEEHEAVRGCLFTIQDVMQSTVRAWLQDKSLAVTHNLGVFGGCGLILSIITGLFGINVDGIPGAEGSPYAFALFSGILLLLGAMLIGIGLLYLGLKKPVNDEHVEVRKFELQELVRTFRQEAESHAQVRKSIPHSGLPPTAADLLPDDASYVLIS